MKVPLQYINPSILRCYLSKYSVSPEKAKQTFSLLVEFLENCKNQSGPCYPDEDIDNAWHTFILHTMEYENFCQAHLGKFIHHAPAEKNADFTPGFYFGVDPSTSKLIKTFVRTRGELINCSNTGNCNSGGSGGDCSCKA